LYLFFFFFAENVGEKFLENHNISDSSD